MYTIFPCVAATSIVVPTPQSHGMKKLPVCTAKLPSSFISICLFPTSTMATGLCLSCDNPWHLILFVFCLCMCVCLHPACVISEILQLCFFFLCVHVTEQPLPHQKKKKVKKAVLHNLRYDYCSVDGVAYVNMHSCRIHKDVIFWQGCNCCCCWV